MRTPGKVSEMLREGGGCGEEGFVIFRYSLYLRHFRTCFANVNLLYENKNKTVDPNIVKRKYR